jgi:hypothetical protein
MMLRIVTTGNIDVAGARDRHRGRRAVATHRGGDAVPKAFRLVAHRSGDARLNESKLCLTGKLSFHRLCIAELLRLLCPTGIRLWWGWCRKNRIGDEWWRNWVSPGLEIEPFCQPRTLPRSLPTLRLSQHIIAYVPQKPHYFFV